MKKKMPIDFCENKRGDRWKLWKDSEGRPQICLEDEIKDGGGDRKSRQKLLGVIG